MTKTTKPRRMARPPEIAANEEAATPQRSTKQNQVLQLLSRDGGAPLSAIIEATGWLPHTARAALTGLRKKGHEVTRTKIEGETRYSVAEAAAQ